MPLLRVYLSKEYEVKLRAVVDVTGRSRSDLIREAIDMLYERYVRRQS